jgi:hypothetical protein
VECENREQVSKSLLNRLVATQAAMYFNPTGLWMWEFGFFLLEKRDPLCGGVKPSEEFHSVVPRVCRLGSPMKSREKVISGELNNNMV